MFILVLTITGSIDGVHSDAPLTWLRTDVNQNLNGSIEVRGLLNIENFQQDSWLINKVNIKDMFNRVVGLNESRQLSSLDFRKSFILTSFTFIVNLSNKFSL